MLRNSPVLTVLLSLGLAACSAGPAVPPPPSPEEVPALESALESDPSDADVGLLLATAYREMGRANDAAAVVSSLRDMHPGHVALTVMAALLAEEEGRFGTARTLYQEAMAADPSSDLREEIERRLTIVRQEELRSEVRQALGREAELSSSPDPATVGVFPFAYEGDDPQWAPLRLALAELLITDLAVTGRLRVVERVKVQALVRELALADAGLVQESTAARGGRILGSGHVVQGQFRIEGGSRIAVDAAVVGVSEGAGAGLRPVSAEDEISALFDLEKQLALDIHTELGVQLTPAERARVNERQTESVQALLAYGRGLAASDEGNFTQAAEQFAQAAELDPSFSLAVSRRQLTAARAANAPRALQNRAALSARKRQAVMALRNAPASARAQILRHMTQKQRAVMAEVLGQDRLGSTILLELVFRRPGGGQ